MSFMKNNSQSSYLQRKVVHGKSSHLFRELSEKTEIFSKNKQTQKDFFSYTDLLLLSLVVSLLFGTALQELPSELFGFDCVTQVGADKVQHLVRRLHLL